PIAPLQRCDAKVRVKMQAFRWAAMLQRKRGRGGGQPSAPCGPGGRLGRRGLPGCHRGGADEEEGGEDGEEDILHARGRERLLATLHKRIGVLLPLSRRSPWHMLPNSCSPIHAPQFMLPL